MKALKKFAITFALTVVALTIVNSLGVAHATSILNVGDNPEAVASATGGETSLRALILRMINYVLGFLGLAAVAFIIYGGVTYTTSGGNDEATGNAKKIIQYAIIGLIVVLLSFVIVQAVLGAGTGVE